MKHLLRAAFVLLGTAALIATTANPAAAARATLINPYPNEPLVFFDLSGSGYALGVVSETSRFVIWHAGRTIEMPDVELAAINDAGQVAGSKGGRATVWDTASGTPIGRDVSPPGAVSSAAYEINNAGQVLIRYALPGDTGPYGSHLAVRTGTTLTEIPHPAGELNDYKIDAELNERGGVVFTGFYPAYWDGSTLLDVESLTGGDTRLMDLNDAGQVVGYLNTRTGDKYTARSFVLAAGRLRWLPQWGGGDTAYAAAINNAGTVVGQAFNSGGTGHGVRWTAGTGTVKDLGTVLLGKNSRADDINDKGEIVGASANLISGRPVYWDASGRLLDLGSIPGARTAWAQRISDNGLVSGYGVAPTGNGETRGLLWTVTP